MKKIVFCTLRDNKGATGGPGGVLYLQKTTLGDSINGVPCEYWFNTFSGGNPLKKWLNKIIFSYKALVSKDTYFFTHDIVSGSVLAHLHKRYSLVFHHQGPCVEENRNLGGIKLAFIREKIMARQERRSFIHANTLHFPANGAADMYFDSPLANCKREEVNVKPALYNIIPMVEPEKSAGIDIDADPSKITLFSLGTLTVAKGQDRVVSFIEEHLNEFGKPVRYIMVGKGPLKDNLLNQLESIKEKNSEFEYIYLPAVSHDDVMYLHKISDIYIMLHRISIFDFATLEAMSQKSAIILSKVGGNKDFDIDGNIIYAEDVDGGQVKLEAMDVCSLKDKNYEVFIKNFTKEPFIEQYRKFFSAVE